VPFQRGWHPLLLNKDRAAHGAQLGLCAEPVHLFDSDGAGSRYFGQCYCPSAVCASISWLIWLADCSSLAAAALASSSTARCSEAISGGAEGEQAASRGYRKASKAMVRYMTVFPLQACSRM